MTKEMEKMIDVVKNEKGRVINTSYEWYLAPTIPEKVKKNILKYYDSNLFVNNIVAFLDLTVFNTCKDGVVFTTDGIYIRFLGKPKYVRYCDIINITFDGKYPVLQSINTENTTLYFQCRETAAFARMVKELCLIDEEYGQTSARQSGKVKKMEIPEDMRKKCHAIIHSAATAAGAAGAGLAQAIVSDNAVIVPIQITMITTLGKQVFDLDITEAMAKSIIASAGATIAGRTASQILVGWIPVIGNAINTTTAAGITEIIGWIAVKDFYNRWLEDKNKGKIDGMKMGYEEASAEYEIKIRQQAKDFLEQKKNMQIAVDEYEKLIEEYDQHITKLEEENSSLKRIAELKEELEQLKKLKEV